MRLPLPESAFIIAELLKTMEVVSSWEMLNTIVLHINSLGGCLGKGVVCQ